MERPWAFTTPRSSSEARWEASLAGALANYPIDRTLFTMMVAATIGFLMMVATKPPVRTEAAPAVTPVLPESPKRFPHG